jgi:hypothetical protein
MVAYFSRISEFGFHFQGQNPYIQHFLAKVKVKDNFV